MEKFILNNGLQIDKVGFGTYGMSKIADGVVSKAIESGFRLIDTAKVYKSEKGIGKAIRDVGIDRKELFITSKVWKDDMGYEKAKKAFERSLDNMGLDYLDLYLIHWPKFQNVKNWNDINLGTWCALTELYNEGKIRAIGVSNFTPAHLKPLMNTAVKPMVNQIEMHPGFIQSGIVDYCKENNIAVEAWSPLGGGRVLKSERLKEIAAKYNKNVGQLCIRWCIQMGAIPVVRSVNEKRIASNLNVFDFEISSEDMNEINSMNEFARTPWKINKKWL